MNTEEFVEWDVCNWGKALDYWEQNTSLCINQTKALEIGGRDGGLSLWLAQKNADVICSDRKGPTAKAKELHTRYGYDTKIQHMTLSALDIPFEEHFDIIFFKSVLGAIGLHDNRENQAKSVIEMHKALKPGGELWFAENLEGSPIHRFTREKFIPWASEWNYVNVKEMLNLLAVFSEVHYTTVGFLGAFGFNEFLRTLLGNIDTYSSDVLAPESWRYIIIGIAKK